MYPEPEPTTVTVCLRNPEIGQLAQAPPVVINSNGRFKQNDLMLRVLVVSLLGQAENPSCPRVGEPIEGGSEVGRVLAADLQQVVVGSVKHQTLGHGGPVAGSPALGEAALIKIRKAESTNRHAYC